MSVIEAGRIETALLDLKKKIGPQMVGWSNKIRNGKVRVYVSEIPPSTATIKDVKIAGQQFGIEYFKVGDIRAL